MPYISPLSKYSSKELNDVFSKKSRYSSWVDVWKAQVKVQVDMGVEERVAFDEISSLIVDDVFVKKVDDYEKLTQHDINAGVKCLKELCPNAKKIQAGLTSMDIDDNERVILQSRGLDYLVNKLVGVGFNVEPFILKGKKPSGAIGHSQDLIDFFNGDESRASEFSSNLMGALGLDYFKRTTQIYPREQDFELGVYLLSIAGNLRALNPDNKFVSDAYQAMNARVLTLYDNSAHDVDHRTIADSVSRRIDIPELYMLLNGVIDSAFGLESVHSDSVSPLSRYASKSMVDAVSKSDYVTARTVLKKGLVNSVYCLSSKVEEFSDVVYLARTHLQPAELTTVGRFLGLTLDKLVNYVDKIDGLSELQFPFFISEVGSSFSSFFETQVFRQALRQFFEPFKSTQVGSNAMPFKQNPNKGERGKGLARMIEGRMSYYNMKNSLWDELEKPELYLILDSIINNFNYIVSDLRVNREAVNSEIEQFKFNDVEVSLLAKVTKYGAVREDAHDELRDIMFNHGGIAGIKDSAYFKNVFGDNLNLIVDNLLAKKPESRIGTSIKDVNESLSAARVILDKNHSLIDKSSGKVLTV